MLISVVGIGSVVSAAVTRIDANGLPITGPPTLDVIDSSGNVIQNYLPEPGQVVTLRIVGATLTGSMTLVNTSSYAGVCTNYGTDSGPDFVLSGTQLTSNDCGGTTDLTVQTSLGTVMFRLPQDSDNDGMPDAWEAQYGNLVAASDTELNPGATDASTPQGGLIFRGDGLAAFDEYRGFLVSLADQAAGIPYSGLSNTKHVRTNPNIKDIFVHVVNNQCAPASPPANLGTFKRYFPGTSNADLFSFAYTLLPGTQLHLLDYIPGTDNPTKSVLWEDFFEYYAVSPPPGQTLSNVVYRTAGGTLTNSEAAVPTDRQINKNARFPIEDTLVASRIATLPSYATFNARAQKGIRLIECQIVQVAGNLGINDWGTVNTPGASSFIRAGNAIVFVERLRAQINSKLVGAGQRRILWSVFTNGSWVDQSPDLARNTISGSTVTPNPATATFLTTRQMQYIVGHEIAHSTQLRPTSLNGYHTSTGSGSMMDATYQVTQDSTNSSTKKTQFKIPSSFQNSDRIEIKQRN
jgi:hypothetical protein